MTATLHPVPVISPNDPSSLLAAHTGSACNLILAASAREILEACGVDPDAILAERARTRKCCAGLTVCTCRTGHRCRCEGCNCS